MIQKKEKKIPVKGVSEKPVKETICSSCNRKRPYSNKTKKLCITCVKKVLDEKAKERRLVKREKKRLSISQLTKKLDTVFSLFIRLDPINCAPQCYACNVGMSGMQYEFGKKIDFLYGQGIADLTVQKSKIVQKFTTEDMLELIEYYTKKVEDLKKEKDIVI